MQRNKKMKVRKQDIQVPPSSTDEIKIYINKWNNQLCFTGKSSS